MPLRLSEPSIVRIENPFYSDFEFVDEMIYVARRTPQHRFLMDCGDGMAALQYAEGNGQIRRQLAQGSRIVLVARDLTVLNRLKGWMRRAIPSSAAGNIANLIPHRFNMHPRTALCEDCGNQRASMPLHGGGDGNPPLCAFLNDSNMTPFDQFISTAAGVHIWGANGA